MQNSVLGKSPMEITSAHRQYRCFGATSFSPKVDRAVKTQLKPSMGSGPLVFYPISSQVSLSKAYIYVIRGKYVWRNLRSSSK